jgi:hypothetical protein
MAHERALDVAFLGVAERRILPFMLNDGLHGVGAPVRTARASSTAVPACTLDTATWFRLAAVG